MSGIEWGKVPAATHHMGGEGIPVFFRMLECGRITDVWGAESDFHFAYAPTDTQPYLGPLSNATRRPSAGPYGRGDVRMISNRDPNKIYLSLLREGDMFVVRDQGGREVAGVKEISLSVAIEEVATFGIVVIDAPTDQSRGQAHTGGAV